jgi:outer membrane protein insertion porin family
MRAWLPGLAVLSLLAPAQSPSAPYPLTDLTIEGNKRFTAEQIVAAAGLKSGQAVSKETFDAARARLMETGAFESVGYGFKPNRANTGYDATFEVAEVALMYRYRFEDLPAPDDALRAVLRRQEILLGDEIPVTSDVLNRYNGALTRYLADKADGKIEVIGRLSYDQPGEPTILFRPAGNRPRISQIHFTGNEAVPGAQLFLKFADVAVGTEFTETAVRRLLDAGIVPLYEARGRLRVAFPKITVEPAKEPDVIGVAVTVTIDEGPAYNLGAVRFAGAAAKQAKELEDLVKWRKDETVNFDEIKAGLKRIAKRYQSTGYLHAAARADRMVNDKEHTVDLVVTVEAGALFTYGKLDIRGLDLIGEPAIRKLWGTKDGKPFDPDYPDTFLKEVHDQSMFDNLGGTTAETKVNEDTKTVDVTLIFAASKPVDAGRRRLGPQP